MVEIDHIRENFLLYGSLGIIIEESRNYYTRKRVSYSVLGCANTWPSKSTEVKLITSTSTRLSCNDNCIHAGV